MATVDIRDVRKTFGNTKVLHGVSVAIEDGQCARRLDEDGSFTSDTFYAVCTAWRNVKMVRASAQARPVTLSSTMPRNMSGAKRLIVAKGV